MRFFADANFAVRAVRLLEAYGAENVTVEHLKDRFPTDKPDSEWLDAIGRWRKKPIVLSGDGRILSRKDELSALRTANMSFVHLAPG